LFIGLLRLSANSWLPGTFLTEKQCQHHNSSSLCGRRMDPEELYRLIERQQELMVHHAQISEATQGEQQPEDDGIDPFNAYQYLKQNQPIHSVVEVSCALDEAPDVPTLPSLYGILAIIALLFLLTAILFFLRRKLFRSSRSHDTINYQKQIWTHPENVLSLLFDLIQSVDSSTQRLYQCNNQLEVVSLDDLQRKIEEISKIFHSLQSSFVRHTACDVEEKLFIKRYSNRLVALKRHFGTCQDIVEKFISTRNSLTYELNTARTNENVSDISPSLALSLTLCLCLTHHRTSHSTASLLSDLTRPVLTHSERRITLLSFSLGEDGS
jgi:hypothetical protein